MLKNLSRPNCRVRSFATVLVTKRLVRGAGRVARTGWTEKCMKAVTGETCRKETVGVPWSWFGGNIKVDPKELGRGAGGVWTGFTWLRIGESDGLLWTRKWRSGLYKSGEFLDYLRGPWRRSLWRAISYSFSQSASQPGNWYCGGRIEQIHRTGVTRRINMVV
jgi:hypothetical protein